jgi:hypothetical protein
MEESSYFKILKFHTLKNLRNHPNLRMHVTFLMVILIATLKVGVTHFRSLFKLLRDLISPQISKSLNLNI